MIIKVILPTTMDVAETEDYPDHCIADLLHIIRSSRYNPALSKEDHDLAASLDYYITRLLYEQDKPSITV